MFRILPVANAMLHSTFCVFNKHKRSVLSLLMLMGIYALGAQPFITRWDLSKPGTSPTSIAFSMTTTGPVTYTWNTVPAGQSGSGILLNGIDTITGLPANATIQLRIDTANFRQFRVTYGGGTVFDTKRIRLVEQWGGVHWSGFDRTFQFCTNLNVIANDVPDLSQAIYISYMFNGCDSLSNINNLNNWDVSNIESLNGAFMNCRLFNQSLSNWDVSHVKQFNYMFFNTAFNQPIANWDVSSATSMKSMFDSSKFNQPIGNWNTSNVIDMSYMFKDCPYNHPLNYWDVSKVNSFAGMFKNTVFNHPLDQWNTGNARMMNYMFYGSQFNMPIGNWNTGKLENTNYMFAFSNFNQPIGNWNTSKLMSTNSMFEYSVYNHPLNNWNVGNVKYMTAMFNHAAYNHPLNLWDVSKVIMMDYMFLYSAFNHPIGNWDVTSVQDMRGIFDGSSFNQNLGNWNFKNCTSIIAMFRNSAMDCVNYSLTLMSWQNNPDLPNNLHFMPINCKYYLSALPARNYLRSAKGWNMYGDLAADLQCVAYDMDTNLYVSVCNSYFFNGMNCEYSGLYKDTLLSSIGVDSFVNLHLTILRNYNYTELHHCGPYLYQGKWVYWNSTFVDSFTNQYGCDSVTAFHVFIHPLDTTTTTVSSCHEYVFGTDTLTNSGTYTKTFVSRFGCDSVATINLVVYPRDTTHLYVSACGPYIFRGQTLNAPGIYTKRLNSEYNCDSILVLHLSMITMDLSVSQNANTLTANLDNVSYQWVRCNPWEILPNETKQSITVNTAGDYAVILRNDACVDTSSCYTVYPVDVSNNEHVFYPNPANQVVYIESKTAWQDAEIRLVSMNGEQIKQYKSLTGKQFMIDVSALSRGFYFVHLIHQDGKEVFKLLKE